MRSTIIEKSSVVPLLAGTIVVGSLIGVPVLGADGPHHLRADEHVHGLMVPFAVATPASTPSKSRPDFRFPSSQTLSSEARTANGAALTGLSLATADFDEDGIPDLATGHADTGHGVVRLYRGRPRSANGKSTPFGDPIEVTVLSLRPDALVAGDFDADGHQDLVAAEFGAGRLVLLAGRGDGTFASARRRDLSGSVTVLAAGDANRADGLEDLIVATTAEGRHELAVLESPSGAFDARAEVLAMSSAVVSVALGKLDDDPFVDVAVAAGRKIFVHLGRDRRLSRPESARGGVQPLRVERIPLPAPARAIATGRLATGVLGRAQLACLLSDGTVHLFGRAPGDDGLWSVIRQWALDRITATSLVTARVAGLPLDDLLVTDPGTRRLHLAPGATTLDSAVTESDTLRSAPAAVLPMRSTGDAQDDIVVLTADADLLFVPSAPAAIFSVVNTADAGPGSLRDAILAANSGAGPDVIDFSIAGPPPHVILPLSPLPALTDPVTIDGTTEPDFAGTPVIVLDGGLAGDASGLVLAPGSDGSVIRGLSIVNFHHSGACSVSATPCSNDLDCPGNEFCDTFGFGEGMRLESSFNIVEGCTVGNANGIAIPNEHVGIHVFGDANTIGGTAPASRNVVAGNVSGVFLSWNADGNSVLGNYIGLDPGGTLAMPNVFNGVASLGSNTIGGPAPGAGNVIAANGQSNVAVGFVSGNVVQGNIVGLDATGAPSVINSGGVLVVDASLTSIGGPAPGARNIVSGNAAGISFFDTNTLDAVTPTANEVVNNYVGTDPSGTLDHGNSGFGIDHRDAADGLIRDNVVSGNDQGGIISYDSDPSIGLAPSQVIGNFIGTDVTGDAPLGNTFNGLAIGDVPGNLVLDNVVGANGSRGILVARSPGALVHGNRVGVGLLGAALGNGAEGISVEDTAGAEIGGDPDVDPSLPNIVAHNATGIAVVQTPLGPSISNSISGNSVFANSSLGIDLGLDGPMVNDPGDPDPGPNGIQNWPSVSLAEVQGAQTLIEGQLGSKPLSTYRIELFSTPLCDPSGFGEGETWLGFVNVSTDPGGNANYSVTLTSALPLGSFVTATATGSDGTSEFSNCEPVTVCAPAAFPETILGSADGSALEWAVARDVAFAIGDLDFVSTYTTTSTGTLTSATEVDISSEFPSPGEGIWVLVREEPCGSWGSIARDNVLP